MKKLASLLVLIIIAAAALAAFPDVPEESEYFDAVEYAKLNGIVNGYDDGTYRPNNTINRAEFVKILVESNFTVADVESCTVDSMAYSDVPSAAWYVPYVCVATKQGIIRGYEDGTFRAANTINFVEAAKIIVATENGGEITGDPWYQPYVVSLSERNAVPTAITTLGQDVTRGEMAEMMHRTLESITNKPSSTYNQLAGIQAQNATLAPVDGSTSAGSATATWDGSTYEVKAVFTNLPEPLPGFFYEGWVVRKGSNLSVISTGVADIATGNTYISNQNLIDHGSYILTLEPDDGDPAPADHVVEGSFN